MVWIVLQNSWRPLLEILIVAVVFYYIFMFLRGTRGWPVALGYFLVLVVLTFISTVLKLDFLSTLLKWFLAFSVVAVPVIFQPEFRRILAQLGNLPLFNTSREQRENIEIVVQAAERLSEVRIGALIAIEQSIYLHQVVESGVIVDCEATPEMLETIFFPNNAIHDGGVILQGDRIAYAACIFPLTRRTDLSKSLGTRHRAAIGLSEETDAVVVVVSEESGAISYAHQGHLVRAVTLEELRAFLSNLLIKREKPRNLGDWLRTRKTERVTPQPAVLSQIDSK